jgi:glycosyltransferase involved in cell wall biosynthesis
MAMAPFLSIIVPFHNSADTCGPLLEQLTRLDGSEEVELIFVDDGSTDRTPELLRDFARRSQVPVQTIGRSRGGPGAARNSGLSRATGKFVWFVDSDDTIELDAISFARQARWPEVDLVVWDWDHPRIVQRLAPGPHDTDSGPAPPEVLDPIVCNWFSLSFIQRTRLRFPEFCFYEATPLESFILPLLLDRYLKVDFVAYRANTLTPSATRGLGRKAPGRYDCLHTIPLGMAFVDQAHLEAAARAAFEAAFVRSFLWYVIDISALPGRSWIRAAQIMRQYRDEATRFRLLVDPLLFYRGRRRSAIVMRCLWLVSARLPSQQGYFRRLRERMWTRDLLWEPPEMPLRYRKWAGVTPVPQPTSAEGKIPRAEAAP